MYETSRFSSVVVSPKACRTRKRYSLPTMKVLIDGCTDLPCGQPLALGAPHTMPTDASMAARFAASVFVESTQTPMWKSRPSWSAAEGMHMPSCCNGLEEYVRIPCVYG